MEVRSISSSTALLPPSSAWGTVLTCSDSAQTCWTTTLCLHTGQSSIQVFQKSLEDVFMLYSIDCVLGQETTWFHYCFAWMIADYRPPWMRGFWPKCVTALLLCPTAKPAEDGNVCHSPLPSASLETLHWEAASHYCRWTVLSCVCV